MVARGTTIAVVLVSGSIAGCDGCRKEPAATTRDAATGVTPKVAALVDASDQPPPGNVDAIRLPSSAALVGVREDKKAVLLRFGDARRHGDAPFHKNNGFRFRWLELDTKKLGLEWEERAWAALKFTPPEQLDEKLKSPDVAADVKKHGEAVGGLLDPSEDKVVASRGGGVIVAEFGPGVFTFDAGGALVPVGPKGAVRAAVSRDGKTIAFLVPAKDKWSLALADAKTRAVTPVAKVQDVYGVRPAFSADGAQLFVAGGSDRFCISSVDVTTRAAKQIACLPSGLIHETFIVSPERKWAALAGRDQESGHERTVLLVNLATGEAAASAKGASMYLTVAAITDEGALVAGDSSRDGDQGIAVIDASAKTYGYARLTTTSDDSIKIPTRFESAAWITPPTTFIVAAEGIVRTWDLSRLTLEKKPL